MCECACAQCACARACAPARDVALCFLQVNQHSTPETKVQVILVLLKDWPTGQWAVQPSHSLKELGLYPQSTPL